VTLREELAEVVAARGAGLLGDWLGPLEVKQEVLAVLHAGRNLLLEGPVGSGKTMLAGAVAAGLPPVRLAGCDFGCLADEPSCPQCRNGLVRGAPHVVAGAERIVRVQGSPDLVAEDLAGDVDPGAALEYGALDVRALRPGRLLRAHRRICFIDELNRLSERLQNLLLELLEEGAMTIGGYDVRFGVDTVVVATMNPSEYVGVERLSEALADRFERVRLDYPSAQDEVRILRSRVRAGDGEPPPAAAEAIVAFAGSLRADPDVETPPSVRATLAAYDLARSRRAVDAGRPWGEVVRDAVRLAFRGRIVLAAGAADAERVDRWLDTRLARFEPAAALR
jgi:Mg-chelatase subunit ChlI